MSSNLICKVTLKEVLEALPKVEYKKPVVIETGENEVHVLSTGFATILTLHNADGLVYQFTCKIISPEGILVVERETKIGAVDFRTDLLKGDINQELTEICFYT